VPFIIDGLTAGEPVAVAVPTGNLQLLRDALGSDADLVHMRDMAVAGRNPGRIIPTVLLAFADAHTGRRVRIIGEPIWAGRSAIEYPACVQHEALINAAFAKRAATILCPYNTALLDPAWVRDAHTTHPMIRTATDRWSSPHYTDPVSVAGGFNQPLPDPPADAATITVDFATLRTARQLVADHEARAGLPPDQVSDLALAVSELATNAVRHGGGTAEIALWTVGDQLVCQVRDAGHLTDPLAGRIPASPDAVGGRGLLLVNQVCDLVRVHTTTTGTTIRIHIHPS
jgi:anti-sigma regulatory factor (Ser/Thr protein kinase)